MDANGGRILITITPVQQIGQIHTQLEGTTLEEAQDILLVALQQVRESAKQQAAQRIVVPNGLPALTH